MCSFLTLENRKYFDCTLEEKLGCMPVIDEIVSLANAARKEGVLALEVLGYQSSFEFIRLGIDLIVHGTEPCIVKEILESLMVTSGKCGVELLKEYIMTIGLQCIQAGENPKVISIKLRCLLGEEAMLKVQAERNVKGKEILAGTRKCLRCYHFDSGKADNRAESCSHHQDISKEVSILECEYFEARTYYVEVDPSLIKRCFDCGWYSESSYGKCAQANKVISEDGCKDFITKEDFYAQIEAQIQSYSNENHSHSDEREIICQAEIDRLLG